MNLKFSRVVDFLLLMCNPNTYVRVVFLQEVKYLYKMRFYDIAIKLDFKVIYILFISEMFLYLYKLC